MKSDHNIQKQIEKAMEASPILARCTILATVVNGEVTLTGHIDKYCKIDVAKKIAKEVEGTKTVNETLSIILNDDEIYTDVEIESVIREKFIKNFGSAHKDVKATVTNGYVSLDGHLKWKYQKELAVECISCIDGIKGIHNNIFIPESLESGVKEKDILAAIYGDISITSDIKVEIFGHKVILKGSVKNTNQKNLITRLVRSVAGVSQVENFIIVSQSY